MDGLNLALDFETFELGINENSRILKENFESILEYYDREFEASDVVSFETGEISENKGLLKGQGFGVKKFGRLRYKSASQKNNNTVLHHIVDSGLGVSQYTWPSNCKEKSSPQASFSVFNDSKLSEGLDKTAGDLKPDILALKAYQECILTCDELSDGETISSESSFQLDSELTQSDGETQTGATEDSQKSATAVVQTTSTEIEDTVEYTVSSTQDKVTDHPTEKYLSSSDVEIVSLLSEEHEVISINSESDSNESAEAFRGTESEGCTSPKQERGSSALQVQLDGKVDTSSEMLSSAQEKSVVRSRDGVPTQVRSKEMLSPTTKTSKETVSPPTRTSKEMLACLERPNKVPKKVPTLNREDLAIPGKRYSTTDLQEFLSPKAIIVTKTHPPQRASMSQSRQCSFKEAFDNLKASLPAQMKPKIASIKPTDDRSKWQACNPCDLDTNNNSPVKLTSMRDKDRMLNVSPDKRYMIEKYLQSAKNMGTSCESVEDPTSDLNLSCTNSTLITESECLADNEESTGNSEVEEEETTSTAGRRSYHPAMYDKSNTTSVHVKESPNFNQRKHSSSVKSHTKNAHKVMYDNQSRSASCLNGSPSFSSKPNFCSSSVEAQTKMTGGGCRKFSGYSPANCKLESKQESRRIATTLVDSKIQNNNSVDYELLKVFKSPKEHKVCMKGQAKTSDQVASKLLGSPAEIFAKLKCESDRDHREVSEDARDMNLNSFGTPKCQSKDALIMDNLKLFSCKTPNTKTCSIILFEKKPSCHKVENKHKKRFHGKENTLGLMSDRNLFSAEKRLPFSDTPKSKQTPLNMGTRKSTPSLVIQSTRTNGNVEKQQTTPSTINSHRSPLVIFAELKSACLLEQKSKEDARSDKTTKVQNPNCGKQSKCMLSCDQGVGSSQSCSLPSKPLPTPSQQAFACPVKPKRLDFSRASGGMVSSTPTKGKPTPRDMLNISTLSSILPLDKVASWSNKVSGVSKSTNSRTKPITACLDNDDDSKNSKGAPKISVVGKDYSEVLKNVNASSVDVTKTSCSAFYTTKGTLQQDICKDTSLLNSSIATKYGARKTSKKSKVDRHKLGLKKNASVKGNRDKQIDEEALNTAKTVYDLSSSPDACIGVTGEQSSNEDTLLLPSDNIKDHMPLHKAEKCLFSSGESEGSDVGGNITNVTNATIRFNLKKKKRSRKLSSENCTITEDCDNDMAMKGRLKRGIVRPKIDKGSSQKHHTKKRITPAKNGKDKPVSTAMSRKRQYPSSSEELENSPKRLCEEDCVVVGFNSSSAFSICEGPRNCSKPFCFSCS